MAWNRPCKDSKTETALRRTGTVRPTVAVRGAVAGTIVVIGAAIAAWLLWPTGESAGEDAASTRKGLIREATLAKAAVAQSEIKKLDPDCFAAKLKSGKPFTNEYGYVFNLPAVKGTTTTRLDRVGNEYIRPYFKNNIDYQLANFLTIEPGEEIVGGLPMYMRGKAFERAFLRSFETAIEISADDPEDIQELKRALMDSKQELKERIDKGENLGDMLESAFTEMQNLALYREDLKQELKNLARQEDITKEDMDDFVAAANKLLGERGVRPLEMPRAAAARFRYLMKKGNGK